ncbi:hypothetical protein DMENIID0001_152290 [Sergentomyia squamirostris]
MIPKRALQPLSKKSHPKGASCDWDSPSSSTGTIKRRPSSTSLRCPSRQDAHEADCRRRSSSSPQEIAGGNCLGSDEASRIARRESNQVPRCIKSNLRFPRVTWKQEEKIDIRPQKTCLPVGPPSSSYYKSEKTPIREGKPEQRTPTFTFRELFRDFPTTPPPYRPPPPATGAKQTKRELIELQQGGKPPAKRLSSSSRIQNEYIMLGPRSRTPTTTPIMLGERMSGIPQQQNKQGRSTSRTIFKNLPVRPRKGTVKHMENYCLFDPNVDFINEKQQASGASRGNDDGGEGTCTEDVIYDPSSVIVDSAADENGVNLSLPKSISGSLESTDSISGQIDKPPPMLAPLSFTNRFMASKSIYARPFSYHSDGDSGFLSPLTPEEPRFDAPTTLLDHCDNIQSYIEVKQIAQANMLQSPYIYAPFLLAAPLSCNTE